MCYNTSVSTKDQLYFVTKEDIQDPIRTSFGENYIISGKVVNCRAIYKSDTNSVKVYGCGVEDSDDIWAEYIEGKLINKVVFYVEGLTDVWSLNKKGEVLAVDTIAKG